MTSISFPPPAPAMSLNDRHHWAQQRRLTKLWRTATATHARAQRVGAHGPSIVAISLPVKSLKQRRDPHNLTPTLKACVDGLVDTGVFVDDDSTRVATLEPRVHLRSERPEVVITITPIGVGS